MTDARTINLPGSGSDTQQYELAPGLLQYVQAVYAVVDNSYGSDTAPLLTISEQSGVVIARKRQGESIPSGEEGSATWALRLDDEHGPPSLPSMHGAYNGGIGPATSGVPLTLDFRGEFAISDPSVFSYLTNSDGYPESIGLEKTGIYLVFASVDWTTTGFTGSVTAGVEDEAGFFQSGHVAVPPLTPNLNVNVETSVIFVYRRYHFANLIAAQSSGVDRTPSQGTLKIVKLS